MRRRSSWLLPLLGVACGDGGAAGHDPIVPDGTSPDCAAGESYPEGAVEPMALGEVLTPYAWPEAASRADGTRTRLDLAKVPCATDEVIDWSPFDVLLFVSIPAW